MMRKLKNREMSSSVVELIIMPRAGIVTLTTLMPKTIFIISKP